MTIVYGANHNISATVTRPADTNAYNAGDVVCNSTSAPVILSFNGAQRNGKGGVIQQAILVDSANQATKPDLELWLFDTAITMDNDNAVFTPTDAELATLVGVIDFGTSYFKGGDATSGAGGNCVCDVQNLGIPFTIPGGAATANTLYGVLVARNAYTPVSGESFTIRLKVLD